MSLDVDYSFSTEPDERAAPPVLRPRLGRHRRRQQELDQDHRQDPQFFAQGYFVYDSKKAGAVTVSHLRFGPDVIRSSYLVTQAQFLACHQWSFLERYDMLQYLQTGGVFLLNSVYGPTEVWDQLPQEVQKQIIDKKLRFYVIDAYKVAKETGMGARINTIMQTCFFNISGVLPPNVAIDKIKKAIKKTYERKGMDVVEKNFPRRRSDRRQPDAGPGARRGSRARTRCRPWWPRKRPTSCKR